jgi:flagellar hook-associated protein 1 FlgK
MSDMLSIGTSALLAYRNALNVVSHNIANANTTGYSRERVDLQAVPGAASTAGTMGDGVEVQSVQRISDGFVQQQLVSDDASYNRINTFQTFASQADAALSDSSAGLAAPLQSFFDSLNSLASTPTSSSTRQSVLYSAQSLSNTFNSLQQQLAGLNSQIAGSTTTTVSQINAYAKQLAQLNGAISQATAQGNGQAPNDLLDQRDQLLRNIGSDVGVTSNTNADGSVDVFLGSGQSLVLGGSANSLSVQADPYGQKQDIVLNSGASSSVITSQLSGGTLGGLLDTQRELIDPAINQLGKIAVNLASAVNAQNAKGMDQYGQMGGALFSVPAPAAIAASSNSGSGSVTASIADAGQLTGSDYVLKYSGSGWSMTDSLTGASVALSGDGSAANPLTGAGLSIVTGGTPAAGDQFPVRPTYNAAGSLQLTTTDPAKVAAAAPVQVKAGAANTGSASIGGITVTDAGNAALLSSSVISFTSASTYSINGAGSYPYTNGSPISVNGVQLQLSGTPATGDSFTLGASSGASGDNSNAVLLAGIASQTLLDGGTDTLASANAALVSGVGAQAQQATAQLSAQTSIRTQDQATRDSASGVNLDEEAASLMQFQQAYQAAAQVISTSNTLFQSLLTALQG